MSLAVLPSFPHFPLITITTVMNVISLEDIRSRLVASEKRHESDVAEIGELRTVVARVKQELSRLSGEEPQHPSEVLGDTAVVIEKDVLNRVSSLRERMSRDLEAITQQSQALTRLETEVRQADIRAEEFRRNSVVQEQVSTRTLLASHNHLSF